MSRFFTARLSALTPYVPGEQPKERRYVKLNTNESPFPPAPGVAEAAKDAASLGRLYPDPQNGDLRSALARRYGVTPENVTVTNGSDEVLNFAFLAFADEKRPLIFPDITYGFYPVFARLHRIPYREIPLKEDFSIDPEDYLVRGATAVIANPNAPTGMALPIDAIEKIVAFDPERVVIVDEAYVDFGAESAVPLTKKYPNLLVTQTFSKSRSLAGARLGYGIGSEELIADLETIRYSTNPYNLSRMAQAAGAAALAEDGYHEANCRAITENRAFTIRELEKRGFAVLPSKANFVFARADAVDGETLYRKAKERGVLIRHFSLERIRDFNRITIGTREEMETLLGAIDQILEEKK